jgi:hypothetical protein
MPTVAPHLWKPSTARRVVLDGFVPIPRGTVPSTPRPLVWPAKDPADVLDFEIEIAPALAGNDGDGIATLDVVIVPANAGDLVLNSAAADGTRAVFWFAGGQVGTTYSVQITIGTQGGRTFGRAVLLPVQSLAAAAPPLDALTDDNGAVVTDQNGNPILVGSC